MGTSEEQKIESLAELSALALSGDDLDHTAEHVVALAMTTIGCDFAGLTVRRGGGRLQTFAPSDPVVEKSDALQYSLGEGPCLASAEEVGTFVSNDVAVDDRWPTWGAEAAKLGLSSLLTARMAVSGNLFGAINLYATSRRRFTVEDVAFAHVFAAAAAATLIQTEQLETLHVGLDSRTLIGQAQGVLMERFGVDADQAFAVLRRYSQGNNIKLRAVAEDLITTRELPEPLR